MSSVNLVQQCPHVCVLNGFAIAIESKPITYLRRGVSPMDNLGPTSPCSEKGSQHSGGVKVMVTQLALHPVDVLVSKEDVAKGWPLQSYTATTHLNSHRYRFFCCISGIRALSRDVSRATQAHSNHLQALRRMHDGKSVLSRIDTSATM